MKEFKKNIKEIVSSLNETNPDWSKYFENPLIRRRCTYNDAYMDETKEIINQLLSQIRRKQFELIDADDDETDIWQELSNCDIPEKTLEIIKKQNNGIVSAYGNVKVLREMKENAAELISAVFENITINYSPEFLKKNEDYGVEDAGEFCNAVLQLDAIISAHIDRHFDKRSARLEFEKVTGMTGTLSLIYCELYEKYQEKIQSNLILDKLNGLDEKLDALNAKINKLDKKVSEAQE